MVRSDSPSPHVDSRFSFSASVEVFGVLDRFSHLTHLLIESFSIFSR